MTTGECKAQNKLTCPHHGEALQRELFAPGGVADILENTIRKPATVDEAVGLIEKNGGFSASAVNLSRTILSIAPGVKLDGEDKLLSLGDVIAAFQSQKELSFKAEAKPTVELKEFQADIMVAAMQRKLFELRKDQTQVTLPQKS